MQYSPDTTQIHNLDHLNMPSYPHELIPLIRKLVRRNAKLSVTAHVKLPSDNVIKHLLDTAFHASFLTEEGRHSGFRIVYSEPIQKQNMAAGKYFFNSDRILTFNETRPFSVSEINRLSPAADYIRTLIGVYNYGRPNSPTMQIWGLIDVGENWHRFMRHDSSGGRVPPSALTITCLNPGELSISIGGLVFCVLRGGQILLPETTELWEGPLNDFFRPAQDSLYKAIIDKLGISRFDDSGSDDEYPRSFYIFFLERVLARIREMRHGGCHINGP